MYILYMLYIYVVLLDESVTREGWARCLGVTELRCGGVRHHVFVARCATTPCHEVRYHKDENVNWCARVVSDVTVSSNRIV